MSLRGFQLGLRAWEVCVAYEILIDLELIHAVYSSCGLSLSWPSSVT